MRAMHPDQVPTDEALVRRLVRQFPQWADLPVTPVDATGTDHDVYRLGDHLAVRLPIIGWATRQAELEARWLPRLAGHLPLRGSRLSTHPRPRTTSGCTATCCPATCWRRTAD